MFVCQCVCIYVSVYMCVCADHKSLWSVVDPNITVFLCLELKTERESRFKLARRIFYT